MFLPFEIETSALILILGVLGVMLFATILWVIRLEIRLQKLFKGSDGKNVESAIISGRKRIEVLEQFRKELETYLAAVEKRLKRSVQGLETIRFNPFKGTGDGGNQSFAVAFLNESGDGVVFSSLYARERMSVFAKPIKNGRSEFGLTVEEKDAIEKARHAVS